MRLEGLPVSYPGEKKIDLHGGMGLNGVEDGPKTPEKERIRAPFHEMLFAGTIDEIIEQIKAVKKENRKIATSYKIEKIEQDGNVGSVTVMFEENFEIDHSDHSKWGYGPEYNPNLYKNLQAS